MSYTIKNTGGTLNIGQLMDFDGEVVDIAANKAVIQAIWKKADGTNNAAITVAENDGDDYDAIISLEPIFAVITGTLDPDATGIYARVGAYNGKSYYKHISENWWLEYSPFVEEETTTPRWYLTSTHETASTDGYFLESLTAAGDYSAVNTATGTATVAVTADNATLPLGTHTIRLESSTDAIVPRNIVVDVLTEAAYDNLYSGTDTQALIAAVAVVDGNVDEIETKTDSLITGLNTLGSRSLNDLYGSNNQLIP